MRAIQTGGTPAFAWKPGTCASPGPAPLPGGQALGVRRSWLQSVAFPDRVRRAKARQSGFDDLIGVIVEEAARECERVVLAWGVHAVRLERPGEVLAAPADGRRKPAAAAPGSRRPPPGGTPLLPRGNRVPRSRNLTTSTSTVRTYSTLASKTSVEGAPLHFVGWEPSCPSFSL